MIKGFLLYPEYEKYFDMLSAEEQAKLMKALFGVGKGADTSELEAKMGDATKMAFAFMVDRLRKDAEKYEQKCEKNRANASKNRAKTQANATECERTLPNASENERTQAKDSQIEQTQANGAYINKNININKNNKIKSNSKAITNIYNVGQSTDDAHFLLNYLNEKAGTHFKPLQSNLKFLLARLKEYSKDDVQKVVDRKVEEWKGTSMQKYLRPETLFNATKFEGYINGLGEVQSKPSAPSTQKKSAVAIRHREYTKEEMKSAFNNIDDFI